MRCGGPALCSECAADAYRARAALEQPSGEVVVTKNESGAIVSVTRQDKEGRVLSVIAESQPSPAPEGYRGISGCLIDAAKNGHLDGWGISREEWYDAARMLAGEQPSLAQGEQAESSNTPGYDQLWLWFGLSRSAYAVLPRVMMHAMPDDWQARFAELMGEWDDHWPNQPDINAYVQFKQNNRFISTPQWLLNYRHPDHNQLNAMRGKDEL